ncbi:NAD-dependent epimerase/dehydratase family protein [Streptomyces pacificus]|uniref:NAD-dependent epimerase/dehydratase family protein n=1 Tax=Streptomyces pacificus TaxID=2705029 RepID=A0A6A0AU50_9ACTN|nr:NAD-dependent epimerase/dehydratase family protein [Streptomyces pacificus]GFH35851.1 NAD-dependent epimerase/dehydratase family protein [Streptomyces pacificus]
MRILVMGGTWFLGREVVAESLRRGWRVTTFTRGLSGEPVPGVERVHGDRTVPADLRLLAAHGPWDAVIDTSSSELPPRVVQLSASALSAQTARWVHLSTVSVYADWPHSALTEESPLLECPADADESYGFTGQDGSPTKYGFQKAGGEKAVVEALGDRAVFLRPGVILGPAEYVGRLPWWLTRAHRGGPIVVPAPADRLIQPVDVRDVAAFAVDQAASTGGGAFNIAHPTGITFADFVQACLEVTGGAGRPVWTQPEVLAECGVKQWTEMPLWRTHAGVWLVNSDRAVASGLHCRPLRDTIADTWAWWQSAGRPVDHPRWADHGVSPEKEAKILASLPGPTA